MSPKTPECPPTFPPASPTDIERYSDKYQLSSPVDSAIDWNPGGGTLEKPWGAQGDVGLTGGADQAPILPPRLEAAPTGAEDPGAAATERQ